MSTATTSKKTLAYYNFDKVMSYNAVYNFIIGARGLGKTFGAKVKAIRNAINKGEEFIYLRRYNTELRGRGTFFADIETEGLFPEYDFRVMGSVAQYAPITTREEKHREWFTIGYFRALSNAQSQKSVAFPRVTTIIFDEFIIEKGALHYLPNEANAFNDFFSTVDRWKDKTKVLFLANAVSIMNPYFLEFGIEPDDASKEFVRKANGFIVVNFADSAEFSTGVYETRFGQFIKDTEYANYSVGSEFSDNHDQLIGRKGSKANYMCSIETRKGTFSVWVDMSGPFYYVQEKRPKQEALFTFVPEWMDENKVLIVYSDKIMQYLRSAFKNGTAWFDTPKARNAFIEIFKR